MTPASCSDRTCRPDRECWPGRDRSPVRPGYPPAKRWPTAPSHPDRARVQARRSSRCRACCPGCRRASHPARVAGPRQSSPCASRHWVSSIRISCGRVNAFSAIFSGFESLRGHSVQSALVRGEDATLLRKMFAQQRRHRARDDLRQRRTSRHVVIHLNHLVERANPIGEIRQRELRHCPFVPARAGKHVLADSRWWQRRNTTACKMLSRAKKLASPGNASQVRARSEGHQQLRLAAQQFGHLLLLRGADGAIQECRQDGPIRHLLDIVAFEVERHRPEHDVHGRNHIENPLRQVDHRLFAAAAGGAPVERDLGFLLRHTHTSSGACS